MTDPEQLVFAALADPTRREVIEILCADGDQTATDLARRFPISRQGIAKHLGILADAHLVSTRRAGRETIYSLNPTPLDETTAWVQSINAAWDKRLRALQAYLLAETEDETD